jgi:hypothetical protein
MILTKAGRRSGLESAAKASIYIFRLHNESDPDASERFQQFDRTVRQFDYLLCNRRMRTPYDELAHKDSNNNPTSVFSVSTAALKRLSAAAA